MWRGPRIIRRDQRAACLPQAQSIHIWIRLIYYLVYARPHKPTNREVLGENHPSSTLVLGFEFTG